MISLALMKTDMLRYAATTVAYVADYGMPCRVDKGNAGESSYKLLQWAKLGLQWEAHTQCFESLRLMTISDTGRYQLRRKPSIDYENT